MISAGNPSAKIWLIGEALGHEEKSHGEPFVGYSGQELRKMLGEVGIIYGDCYACNILDDVAPKGKIENCFYTAKEAKQWNIERIDGRYPNSAILNGRNAVREALRVHRPNLIIALGATPLWALCGENGITKWRGSILEGVHGIKCIPTFNPAGVLRQWQWRWLSVQDLRRSQRESTFPDIRYPDRQYVIAPNLDDVMDFLIPIKDQDVVADTETHGGQIDCIGIGTSKSSAICIPFNSFRTDTPEPHYWSLEDEILVVKAIQKVMKENNIIWQNCLYDMQYLAHDWGYLPNTTDDIMLMHHVCFSELPNNLPLISSLHCEYYKYWKDDNKEWNPRTDDVKTHWIYNCDDCAYTFENYTSLKNTVEKLKQEEQYRFLMNLVPAVLKMMLRGCPIDAEQKNVLAKELQEAKTSRSIWFKEVLGHELNPDSSKQMLNLIYGDFGVKPIISRKTGNPTLDDKALKIVIQRQPLLRPLIETVEEYRSIRVFKSNFVDAKLGEDERMRSSFNIGGTNTFRFSASKDAFGNGCNIQTIPKGTEKD